MTATIAAAVDAVRPAATIEAGDRRFVRLVLLAVVAGFAVRLAIALTDDAPTTDETAYLRSGTSLLDGDGFERDGRAELHFPPLAPAVLGAVGKVLGDGHRGAVAVTLVAGTALIVPLALLGRRLADDAGGIAAAWIAALTPGLSTTLVNRGAGSEALYALRVVGALALVATSCRTGRRPPGHVVLAAGALTGLAYLTRPEGLLIAAPLLGAGVVWSWRRAGGPPAALRFAALFAVPVVACIVPYSTYLHAHTGEWQLTAKTRDASIEAWARRRARRSRSP